MFSYVVYNESSDDVVLRQKYIGSIAAMPDCIYTEESTSLVNQQAVIRQRRLYHALALRVAIAHRKTSAATCCVNKSSSTSSNLLPHVFLNMQEFATHTPTNAGACQLPRNKICVNFGSLENAGPQLIKKAKMQRGCLHSVLILDTVDYGIIADCMKLLGKYLCSIKWLNSMH